MKLKFERVIHVVDSEIVQAMVWKESYRFNTFVANRIGELHQTTKPDEWYWVAGKPWLNVADMTTRGCSPKELQEGSIWQDGPEFLKQEEELWPTESQPKQGLIVPEMKGKLVASVSAPETSASLCDCFNLERFSKWRLLVHTTARIMCLYNRMKNGKEKSLEPGPQEIKEAEFKWYKNAQKSMDTKELRKLNPSVENDVIVVGGRTERWMEATWNRQRFILLPKEHKITELMLPFQGAHHVHARTRVSVQ
jgi:hypothetical protein